MSDEAIEPRPSRADLLATVDRDLCEALKDGALRRLPVSAEQVGLIVARYLAALPRVDAEPTEAMIEAAMHAADLIIESEGAGLVQQREENEDAHRFVVRKMLIAALAARSVGDEPAPEAARKLAADTERPDDGDEFFQPPPGMRDTEQERETTEER